MIKKISFVHYPFVCCCFFPHHIKRGGAVESSFVKMASYNSHTTDAFYFTLCNPSLREAFLLRNPDRCEYAITRAFSSEHGTEHLQGYVVMDHYTRAREMRWKEGFNRCFIRATERNTLFPETIKKFGPYKEVGTLKGPFVEIRPEEIRLMNSMNAMRTATLRPWQKAVLDKLDNQNNRTIMIVVVTNEGRYFLGRYIEDMRSAFRFENPLGLRECMDAYQNESYAVITVTPGEDKYLNFDVIRDLKETGCKTLVLMPSYPDRDRLNKYMKGHYRVKVLRLRITNGSVDRSKSDTLYSMLKFCSIQ